MVLSHREFWLLLILSVSVFGPGCSGPVDTSYGTLDRQSINGTLVLREVLGEKFKLKDLNTLSDRATRADFIVHVHLSNNLPDDEFTRWILRWLEAKPGRQFVSFLRDGNVTKPLVERWLQELSERRTAGVHGAEARELEADEEGLRELLDLEVSEGKREFERSFPLVRKPVDIKNQRRSFESNSGFILLEDVPQLMSMGSSIEFEEYEADILLRVLEHPFLVSGLIGESRWIVAANTTPFLDGALPDPAARELLDALLDYLSDLPTERAYWLLESRIGEADPEVNSMLRVLFQRPPMSWISTHFLLLGLILVWSRWKWLGRTQGTTSDAIRSAHGHPRALGIHLEREKAFKFGIREIARWFKKTPEDPANVEESIRQCGKWIKKPSDRKIQ